MKAASHLGPMLTPNFVAQVLEISPLIPQNKFNTSLNDISFTGVFTDSRKIQPGSLFVALKGDQFDGHDFIENAIAQGARGILCQRYPVFSSSVSIFLVNNPLTAYRQLAAAWREKFSIPVIVIAGSAGKTTTKELLAALLQGKWTSVLKTHSSQNGFIGIAMTLLDLKPEHQAAIIEVGIDEVGAMESHLTLIHATAGLLTCVGPEHLEKLQDLNTVAKEETLALFEIAKKGGLVAINLDDPWIQPCFKIIPNGRKLGFTLEGTEKTPTQGEILFGQLQEDGKTLEVSGLGIKKLTFSLPLLGRHNAQNLLAALTIARGLGLTPEEMTKGLQTFQGLEGRSQIRELPGPQGGKLQVLCDYYNAQPASMKAGLQLLTQILPASSHAQRWACLGDMLELGKEEEKLHRELATPLMEYGIENIYLLGPRMQCLQDELKKQGFSGKLQVFSSQQAMSKALITSLQPSDAILIKGSRGMKMEEVWKNLEAHSTLYWRLSIGNPHEC